MSIQNSFALRYATSGIPGAAGQRPFGTLWTFALWTALAWCVTDHLPGQEKTGAPADSEKPQAPIAFDYLRLSQPSVAEHVQLTDAQRAEITQLLTARATQLSQASAGERPAVIAATNQKLAGLLTAEQRERLSTLPATRALYFQFVEQTWPEVLTWFAEQSDLSLVMNEPPGGTFTYRDMKGYSPRDAIDLLNSVLLTKGFSLVRRDRTLILMALNGELTSELIPTISFDKLDQRGRFEFVTILFPLGKRAPLAVDTAVQQLLKPYGRALTLAQTKQIRITDMAAKMPAYSLLISSVPEPKPPARPAKPAPPPKPVLQTYPYQGFDAQVGVQTLKSLIPGVTYYADQKAKQISVFGTPNQQTAVKAILAQLTKIPPRETASLLEVYVLQSAPSETLPAQLKLVAPDAQVSIDPAQLRVAVYGSPSEQAAIRAALEKLGIQQQTAGNQQLRVYDLKGNDPTAIRSALEALVPGISLHATSDGLRLLARASNEQHTTIAGALSELAPATRPDQLRTLRFYPRTQPLPNGLLSALESLVSEASLTWNAATLRLSAVATAPQHAAILETLRQFDADGNQPTPPQLKIYPVNPLQRERFSRLQSNLLDTWPGMRVIDSETAGELAILATPAQHLQFGQLLETLITDAAKTPRKLQSYPLPGKTTDAIRGLVTERVPEAQLTWDDATDRLIVLGTEQEQEQVQQVLGQIAEHLPAATPPQLKIYPVNPLQRERFSRLQSNLLDTWPGMRVIDSETAGELAILATPAQHLQFGQLLETLITDAAKTPRKLQSYPLPGKTTDAIRGLVTERVPEAQLTWDDATDRLIVLGTEQEQEQVQQVLGQIAEHLPAATPPQLKIYPVNPRQRQRFVQLQAALTAQFPDMQIVENTNSRELVIWATPRQHQQLVTLLKTLSDRQAPADRTVVVAYPVTVGVPSEARELLAEMYPALKIIPDDAHQRLLVWATEEEHEPLQAFMEQWNRAETPSQTRKLVPYQFAPDEAEPLLPVVTELVPKMQLSVVGDRIVAWGSQRDHDRLAAFAEPLLVDNRPPNRHVEVYPTGRRDPDQILQIFLTLAPTANYAIDPKTGGMAMLATPEEHETMRATLEKISHLDQQPGKDRVLELYQIEPASVSETSQLLQDALPDLELISTAPGRLLVQGTADEHKRARDLIEKIRASVPAKETREVRVHPVRRMPAAAMLGLLPPDLLESVSIRTQEPNLIINGSPRMQRALTAAIKQIEDQLPPPPVDVTPVIQVHTVRRMSAAALIDLLPPSITAQISIRRQDQHLIVSGNRHQHAALAAAIRGIEEQFPDATAGATPVVRVYKLRFATARSADRLVEELLPDASSILDSASQSIVVTTTPAEHERVTTMLQQLDQPQQTEKSTRIYSFQHCNPAPAQTVLASLVPNANISVDTTVMKLVATATDEEHKQIAAVCEQLDQQSEQQQPISRVYRLPPQTAPALQTAINGLLPQATVTLESASGTVVVTAPAAEHTKVLELVEQLAQRGEAQQVVSRVYRLPPQSAPALQTAINGLLPQATVTLESASGTVVVTAPAAEQTKVLDLVEQLAQGGEERQVVSRVYRLPPQSAPALQTAVNGLLPQATVTLESTSGTVVVTAPTAEHTKVKELVDQLAQPDVDQQLVSRVYRLPPQTAPALQTAINGLLPRATVAIDETSGTVVVTAPAAEHTKVKELVDQLAQPDVDQQLVSRVYRLPPQTAPALQTAIKGLLPQATVALDDTSGTVVVAARPREHQQILDLVEQMKRNDPSAARIATTYQTGSMSAEVVADAVRAAFPENDVSCHPSKTDRSLVVVAPPAYQPAIRSMVAQVSGGENPLPSTVRVYELGQANGESVRTVLGTLFSDQQPRAEIRLNRQGNQLLAVASERQHSQIEITLKQLQGSRRVLEVFPLRVVDPFTAQSSIEQLFRDAAQNTAPITDVDSVSQKLFVRATPEQIMEIREMLGKMGEPSLAEGKTRGPLRVIPLDGNPLEAIQRMQRIWSELRENEIRILSPDAQPPAPNPAPPQRPQPPATAPEKPIEPAPTAAHPHRLTAATPVPPAAQSPILIIPGPNGITIASSDQEALDRFETLLRALLRNDDTQTGPASNFSIIPLKNADSSQIQKLLRELWEDMPFNLRGGPGDLVVVAAERLNSLVVYGSRTDRKIAEYLATSLDTPDPASAIGLRKPRILSIEHTDAQEIYAALRAVYKSQLTTGGGRKSVSIPEGVSSDVASVLQQINAAATAPLLTLHVDQKTNSIVVNAPLQLADEIAEFVTTMDAQAQTHPARTVQLIPLKGGNARRVRRALEALRD